MAEELIPIVQRAYDFAVDLHGAVNRFPRAQKPLLGSELIGLALRLLLSLATANGRRDKVPDLDEASGTVDAPTQLETGHGQAEIPFVHARESIARWLGLAQHASTFRLSRSLFLQHDVRNVGKRLLLKGKIRATPAVDELGSRGFSPR